MRRQPQETTAHEAITMANEVTVKFQASIPVKNKDIEVAVSRDNQKLDTLLISQGNIEWVPTGHSVNTRRLSWVSFAEFMENSAATVKTKK